MFWFISKNLINNDFYLVKSLKIKKITRFTPHYPTVIWEYSWDKTQGCEKVQKTVDYTIYKIKKSLVLNL